MKPNFKIKKSSLLLLSASFFFWSLEARRPTLKDFPRLELSKTKQKLTDFCFNDFSQFGEDGIIEKIFEIIGTNSKIAVEFGAHDGLYCSNIARLWKKKGWKAVLIEGSKKHFPKLIENTKDYDCLALCQYVGIENNNNIETILKHNSIEEVDLLSIDIDGNDYYIFENLRYIKPRVIIAEYNPSLPASLDVYQPYDPESKNTGFGASVGALSRIAKSKGYTLVAVTICNCIFVRDDFAECFDQFETSLRELQFEGFLKYIVTDYAGQHMIIGKHELIPFGLKGPASHKTLFGKIRKFPSELEMEGWTVEFR